MLLLSCCSSSSPDYNFEIFQFSLFIYLDSFNDYASFLKFARFFIFDILSGSEFDYFGFNINTQIVGMNGVVLHLEYGRIGRLF
jgi:hypothetical protein